MKRKQKSPPETDPSAGNRSSPKGRPFIFSNLILHLHPPRVPESTLRFTHTYGLGGMSLVLVMLSVLTGMLMLFVYEPSVGKAYASIIALGRGIWFGQLIRNIHYWSGNALIVVVFFHILRVFYTHAYRIPRRLNWLIGFCLFGFVLCLNFTGNLLPWDQMAYWATTVCTNVLEYAPGVGVFVQKMVRGGGPEVGQTTLSFFFASHVIVLPIGLLVFLPFHFWQVRKAGGVIEPTGTDEESAHRKVNTIPDLVIRELTTGLVLIAFILMLSLSFDAPLDAQANPGLSPNPTKAPWFFMSIQELLLHLHPLFAVFIIPLLVIGALAGLPYLLHRPIDDEGPDSRKTLRLGILSALTGTGITLLGILGNEYVINLQSWMPDLPDVVASGLIPTVIMISVVIGFYTLIRKKWGASNREAIHHIFTVILASFLTLMIIGIWFRGPGMALVWPW